MNAHRETQGLLYDHALGALDGESRRLVEEHLGVCGDCRSDLELIREVMQECPPTGETPAERLGEGYWTAFAEQVETRIRTTASRRPGAWEEMAEKVIALLSRTWKPVWATAGVLAVMVLVFVTTVDLDPGGQPVAAGTPAGVKESAPDSTALRLARYLNRSNALLVGIANRKPHGDLVDLSIERDASRSLVRESRELRDEALDTQSAALVSDLERIMIEIGSRDEFTDRDHFDLIRNGISDGNLLFKIRMTEEMMSRQVPLQTASYGQIR